jgi:hypothetical protein
MALSGLVIIFVSIIPWYHYYKLKLDIIRIDGKIKQIRAESELYKTVFKEIKKPLGEWNEMYLKQYLAEIDIQNQIAEKDYLHNIVLNLVSWSIVGLSVGFALAIKGFELWYKKLQAPQDKLLQQQLKQKIV